MDGCEMSDQLIGCCLPTLLQKLFKKAYFYMKITKKFL